MIDRVQTYAWDGAQLLRGAFDVVRWPLERVAWATERALLWPLRERSAKWGLPVQAVALGGVALLAAGAVLFGAIRAGDKGEEARVVVAPAREPVKAAAPTPATGPTGPVLEGTSPDFTAKTANAATKVAGADTVISSNPDGAAHSSGEASSAASSSTADAVTKDPGPAAIEVAHRFSSAFVLYETGSADSKVREAFAETATPQLARELLKRPPRLPANVEVPKAKVLNVVPGPRHGKTFTLSASLLRVGVTSELRIDVQQEKKSGAWLVTDVLG